MTLEEKLGVFRVFHQIFLDMLLDDTWLCEEPINVDEVKACWNWIVNLGIETVSEEEFEESYGFTFEDLTNWWNKSVLRLQQ